MAIYYALLQTTGVPEWDAMFKRQYRLIDKYGKREYIHSQVEAMEHRKEQQERERTLRGKGGKESLEDGRGMTVDGDVDEHSA